MYRTCNTQLKPHVSIQDLCRHSGSRAASVFCQDAVWLKGLLSSFQVGVGCLGAQCPSEWPWVCGLGENLLLAAKDLRRPSWFLDLSLSLFFSFLLGFFVFVSVSFNFLTYCCFLSLFLLSLSPSPYDYLSLSLSFLLFLFVFSLFLCLLLLLSSVYTSF